jgi:[ribosomal protein S5]-alanine N-acetyltransferase
MGQTRRCLLGSGEPSASQCKERRHPIPTLETPRLLLREFEQASWLAVQQYAADPEVVRYLTWGPNTEEETRTFLARTLAAQQSQPRLDFELAVILKGERRLIGGCRLHLSSLPHRQATLGYGLERAAWRQGYATEAALAMLAFGFEQVGLHRIFAICDPANTGSARVLEKIGMHYEGHLREHLWVKGHWRDSLLYAILEQEWKPSKRASSH